MRVFAEKASTHMDISIPVPKETKDNQDDKQVTGLDLAKPATLASQALRQMSLSTRLEVHGFLTKLPAGTTITGARTKVVKAATDNRIYVTWDGKTKADPERLLKAYEFLDSELSDAEWELEATGGVLFSTGRALVDWQKENSIKIAPRLITH